eukprot:m.200315 g.200315  ORF g.200315 m.200315 type:complete len:1181 (-) comp16853_c0_seq9:124-3666(-)
MSTYWRLFQEEKNHDAFICELAVKTSSVPMGWPTQHGHLILRTKRTGDNSYSPRIVSVSDACRAPYRLSLQYEGEDEGGKVAGLWECLGYKANPKAGVILSETGDDTIFLVANTAKRSFDIYYRKGKPLQREIRLRPKQRPSTDDSEADAPRDSFLQVQGAMRLNPDFLKREARQRHEWIFGAFAELIHNSSDADAAVVEIDVRTLDGHKFIELKDDGVGMSKDEIQTMMRLGRQQGVDDTHRSGRFGYGFKTGSMRIAHHAVVLTRSSRHSAVSIGFLSRKTVDGRDDIKCETTTLLLKGPEQYAVPEHKGRYDQLLKLIEERTRCITGTMIGQWIGQHVNPGTTIYLCDLVTMEHTTTPVDELDTETDANDILIWQESLSGEKKPWQRQEKDGVLCDDIEMDYSLRKYISVMYRTLQTRPASDTHPRGIVLQVKLRGTLVRRIELEEQLSNVEHYQIPVQDLQSSMANGSDAASAQRPSILKTSTSSALSSETGPSQSSAPKPVRIAIGFSSAFQNKKLGGINLYSANCLISSWLRNSADITAPDTGLGVVLLAELPKESFEPQDNKQQFEKTIPFKKLLLRLNKIFLDFDQRLAAAGSMKIARNQLQREDIKDWLQCDACNKWRKLDKHYVDVHKHADKWFCFQDGSPLLDRSSRPCKEIPEDEHTEEDRLIVDDEDEVDHPTKRSKLETTSATISFRFAKEELIETTQFAQLWRGSYTQISTGRTLKDIIIECPIKPTTAIEPSERVLRELKLLCSAKGQHPNITPFLFLNPMDCCFGYSRIPDAVPFSDYLKLPHITPLQRYRVVLDVTRALLHCMNEKIRVPCLYPSHILVKDGPQPVGILYDFEFGRRMYGQKLKPAFRERLLYTPLECHKNVDASSPEALMYGLALLTYEALTAWPVTQSNHFRLLEIRDLFAKDKTASVLQLLQPSPKMAPWESLLQVALNVAPDEREALGEETLTELAGYEQQAKLNSHCTGPMYHVSFGQTKLKRLEAKDPPFRFGAPKGKGRLTDFVRGLLRGQSTDAPYLNFVLTFEMALYLVMRFRLFKSLILALEATMTMVGSPSREIHFFKKPEDALQELQDETLARQVGDVCEVAVRAKNLPAQQAFVVDLHKHKPLVARLLQTCQIEDGTSFAEWKTNQLYTQFTEMQLIELRDNLEIPLADAVRWSSSEAS